MQQADESRADSLELVRGQGTEFPLNTRQGNRLDLLQVKHTGGEEGLGYGQLPTIAAYSSCVRYYDDQREFVISGVVAQNEAGPHFGGQPRSTSQTSPALGLGILCLQGVEHQEVLVRAPVTIRQCLGIGFDVK